MAGVVLLVAAVYLANFAYRGWIPHDSGTLAQCAERVLGGELPHRDFDSLYTGGLSYLNAAAFQVLGCRLSSIRTVLFVFALGFVLASYAVAVRVTPPWVAALIAVACMGWSIPNYFAALPSWYNLFFATFGLLALLHYIDTGRRRWLFVAGFCGGLGVLAKIVGLYALAAASLFLVYRVQRLPQREPHQPSLARRTARLVVPGLVAAVWLTLLWRLVRRHADAMVVLQFIVPSAAVCAALLDSAWRSGRGAVREKVPALLGDLVALWLGAALPVACFLVPFVSAGAADDLFRGVFITPRLRLDHATYPLPPLWAMRLEVPVACLLALGFTPLGRRDGWLLLVVAPMLIGLLLYGSSGVVQELVFVSARCAVPVVAVLAAWLLLRPNGNLSVSRRQEVFLVVATMAFHSLLQFPFAAPIYFCYVAPLVGLGAVYLVVSQPYAARRVSLAVLVFCLLFALCFLNRRSFCEDPRDPAVHALTLPRADLRVSRCDKRKYEALVRLVREHSQPASYIYATPDCPEVYFLAERKNPTRNLFELFDAHELTASQQLELIERHNINVVVVNLRPGFSRDVSPEFLVALSDHFPKMMMIDNFLVCYRHAGGRTRGDKPARSRARRNGQGRKSHGQALSDFSGETSTFGSGEHSGWRMESDLKR